MRLCLDGERGWGGVFPRILGGFSLTRTRCPVPRELSAGTLPAAAADGTGSENAFGKSFYYGASSSGSSEISRAVRAGWLHPESWISLRQTSPSQPGGRRRCDALPALAKFRDFCSSRLPLPAPWDKQTLLCLLSPLPLLREKKGTWGSAADGSGCFSGCRKSGLSWQARSEVWMGENKWSVIGFSFSTRERCWFLSLCPFKTPTSPGPCVSPLSPSRALFNTNEKRAEEKAGRIPKPHFPGSRAWEVPAQKTCAEIIFFLLLLLLLLI